MSSANIKTATDDNFEKEVLGSDKPVLVDFWATWCAPCRAIAPIVDQIADQYAGKLEVFKLDIDSNPGIPGRLGIRGIPTLILFKGGKAVDQVVGAVPKENLVNMVQKAL